MGKTILCAIVIYDLLSTRDEDTGIAYIYFDYNKAHIQGLDDLFASLLKQFAARGFTEINKVYERHKDLHTKPRTPELLQTLQLVIKKYKRTFIVLDALDECQTTEGNRHQFLGYIFELQQKCNLKILATTRLVGDIEQRFKGRSTKFEIQGNPDDIERFLISRVRGASEFLQNNPESHEDVISALKDSADGV